MKKLIIILFVLAFSFTECEAQRKRKRNKRHKFTKERVTIHRVTPTEKVGFAILAIGLLAWSYRE